MATAQGFSKRHVLPLLPDITYRQLDYWARTKLVVPSVANPKGTGHERQWSWWDLIALQVVSNLIGAGASVQRIRNAIAHLKKRGKQQPLHNCVLAVATNGRIFEVVERDKLGELLTGSPGQTFWLVDVGTIASTLKARAERRREIGGDVQWTA